MIFSKSYCQFCDEVKKIFEGYGVKYEVIEMDLEQNGGMMVSQLKKISGLNVVPNTYIGGQNVGGYDQTKEAVQDGSLEEMLREAGICVEEKVVDVSSD